MATDKIVQENSYVPRCMALGALLIHEGEVVSNFQDSMILAQKEQIASRVTQMKILDQVVQATENQGLLQASGSLLTGGLMVAGSSLAIGGNLVGTVGAAKEGEKLAGLIGPEGGAELNGEAVGAVGAEPEQFLNDQEFRDAEFFGEIRENAPEPEAPKELSDADKRIQQEKIAKDHSAYHAAGQIGQAIMSLCQGAGQLANAPLQAAGAKEQANAKAGEILQSANGQLLSSAESAAQNAQSNRDQTLSMIAQTLQSNVILAQAH